jgi:hypothetical protein
MFILHVGPHKTATTWMQMNLHANAGALEKAGWLYPQTGERVVVAHHDLSDNPGQVLDDASRKVATLRRIAEKARAADLHIVLSSEGFRKWEVAHLEKLQAIMAPHEMRIVYTLRDPVTLVYSLWSQMIKSGGSRTFPEYYERQLKKTGKAQSLNPVSELQRFSRVKGAQLTVLLYDEIRRQNRDIFDVFTRDVLGTGPLQRVEADSANQREPLEMTEFMRAMLVRMGRWKGKERVNIGRVFKHMLLGSTKDDIVAAVAAVTAARNTIEIDRDDERLADIERQLRRKFADRMIPPPGEKLFLDGKASYAWYDDTVLAADPRVKALLDDLTNKFRPGGLRMTIANLARSSLMTWRRLVNRFR